MLVSGDCQYSLHGGRIESTGIDLEAEPGRGPVGSQHRSMGPVLNRSAVTVRGRQDPLGHR